MPEIGRTTVMIVTTTIIIIVTVTVMTTRSKLLAKPERTPYRISRIHDTIALPNHSTRIQRPFVPIVIATSAMSRPPTARNGTTPETTLSIPIVTQNERSKSGNGVAALSGANVFDQNVHSKSLPILCPMRFQYAFHENENRKKRFGMDNQGAMIRIKAMSEKHQGRPGGEKRDRAVIPIIAIAIAIVIAVGIASYKATMRSAVQCSAVQNNKTRAKRHFLEIGRLSILVIFQVFN